MFRFVAKKAFQQRQIISNSLTKEIRFVAPCPRLFSAAPATPATTTDTTATDTTPLPSVKDVLIDLIFIDPSGARRKVKGMIGQTLHEAAVLNKIDIGWGAPGAPPEVKRSERWIEPTFGEGPSAGFDHVVLVGKGAEAADRITPIEQEMIEDYWDEDEIYEGSRLASSIVLKKEMDGMAVYVPDRLCEDIP